MARRSTKENKNIYQTTRENLDLTREEASELLETVSPERIEKIENERSLPYPDEVLLMSDKYKQPTLCNYYCANQCPIGQQYVPEIKLKDLSQIVLETIASLNAMQKKKERLIEITVDGKISDDEIGILSTYKRNWKRFRLLLRHCSFGARKCWIPALSILRSIVSI